MKVTKKLIGASVALVVAASLTVGSTFAWFTYQSNVQLEKVGFFVDSGDENLQIAVVKADETPGNGDFVYSLPATDIVNKIRKVGDPDEVNVVYKALTLASDTVLDTDPIELQKADGSAAQLGEYATFDLVFRYTPFKGVNASNIPWLVLDYGSAVTAEIDDTNYMPTHSIGAWGNFDANDYGIELKKDDVIKARARDAARVAFVFGESTNKQSKVWAPSEEFDTTTIRTSDTAKGFYKGNLASDFRTSQGYTTTAVTTPVYNNRIYAAIQNPTQANDFNNSTIAKLSLPAEGTTYSEFRMTVKVWLEGRDGDCIDAIFGDQFNFALKFRTSLLKAPATT